jgi:hypothetical protein
MTGPGPNAAALRLGQRLDQLHRIIEQLRDAEQASIEARHEANVREWKHFLSVPGAVETRKITARLEVEAFTFAADNAEAEVRHLLRSMKEAQMRVDAGRTYSADLRAELFTLGRDGAA